MNLKIGQLIEIIHFEEDKKKIKKNEQSKIPVGRHQVYQHLHNQSPRRRQEEKQKKIFKEIMA